jgi:hypothetical protein
MIRKIALILLLSISIFPAMAQETVSKFPLALKKDRDVFQIVDSQKKEVLLFISDKQDVNALRLDEGMNIIDSMSAPRPEKKYSNMIGYNNSESGYRIFWAYQNMKEILTQRYDFGTKKVVTEKYSLPLEDEKVIQKFSTNGNFYVMSVLKNSNTVKLHTFNSEGKHSEKIIVLQGFRFFTPTYERTNFYSIFANGFGLKRITTESPTSLTDSSSKGKFYCQENKAIMTFDENFDYTQVITINLDTFAADEKFIKKAFIPYTDRYELNSNSFLLGEKLYQVKISSYNMILTIKDLNDNLLTEYRTINNVPIEFKNTDIIQENEGVKHTRILEKTSQFIAKINNFNLGVSGYKLDGLDMITLGCVSNDHGSDGAVIGGAMMFGIAGALIAAAITNPTMENFNAYANRKVVYINCLFDEKGQHVKGALKPLAFDGIRAFADGNKNSASETLFKIDRHYLFGFYDTGKKEYTFKKFVE